MKDEWHDEELLSAYRRIAADVDGTPDDVLVAARAAFLTRDLDAAIAVLVADSRNETAYETVRAEPDPAQGHWLLSFEGGGIQVDLEVREEQGRLRLLGLLSGTSSGDCFLEQAGERHRVDVDPLGRFVVVGVAHGPIRLRCRSSDGTRVTTTWVTI
ncbi:hypothetical protein [Asanoa iriomotensis]|uniref:Uncharacterized protein n=1 Tax=Asanoa iriomotensis TaxID=234613 RepID=A0ABQ4CF56_9ACTN|nr:hypothetical protein [Asanoa iriomotensis]GIF61403.1 hypothetical protein Air01nite_74980 [Asanoa iriomotensis]